MNSWLRDPQKLGLILISGLALFYFTQLPVGQLYRFDEFLTLDRTNGFLRFGDWTTVYSSNLPNFQKPPLQYWMGAVFLGAGVDETVAIRIPSWIFSVVCLVATASLARSIVPAHPHAAPAAVILLASSTEFWSHAMSGMLETGSAAFVTLALLFAYRALKEPANWWWVAVAVGLGALQKSPGALAAVAVFVAGAALAARLRGVALPGLRSRIFPVAGLLALCLAAAWPLLQILLHGSAAIRSAVDNELIGRFSPDATSGMRGFGDVWGIVIRDEPFLRLGAIAGLFVLPTLLRDPRLFGFTAVVLGYVASIVLAGGAVYPRYTLNLVPLFCAVVAVWIFQSQARLRRKWILTGIMSLLLLGPLKPAILVSGQSARDQAAQSTVLPTVGMQLQDDETLVVCGWDRKTRFSPGAVSFYASNGRPFVYLTQKEDLGPKLSALTGRPIRGVCSSSSFAELSEVFDAAEVVERLAPDYVVFTVRP
ncbi:hypothetical protein BYZ73_18490 [Rhodovulum viride]|uniref:Glycosyltransferase RgtA/B/C/D-like domain-containing protein n=1 Tax=Rhodovulum viride TaxID=1231134 RepID=A0ABX9DDZ5_9RHOB|nr:glycosyltransferase family 39 protein [Rhodovulum viride]RAP39815.1 hypothetical protein BYZ73_18490 [Rhodovulum viride]